MSFRRWCLDCNQPIELDRHGRCSCCGSDAVAFDQSLKSWAELEVMELERLFNQRAA